MKRDYPTINVIETGRHLKSLMMDRGLNKIMKRQNKLFGKEE